MVFQTPKKRGKTPSPAKPEKRRLDWQVLIEDEAETKSICVTASSDALRTAGSLLYDEAASLPFLDDDLLDNDRPLFFDRDRQKKLMIVALQLMAQSVLCGIEDDMYLLRQSASDPCVLEQSTDGGESWTLAFDYGLCLAQLGANEPSVTEINNYVTNVTNQYANNLATYDDDLDNIWTNRDPSDTQDAAMCIAIEMLVDMIAEMHIEAISKKDAGVAGLVGALSSIFAGVVGVQLAAKVLPLVGFIYSPWVAMGLAMASVGLRVAEQLVSTDKSIYEDLEARKELACCMYNNFKGAETTMLPNVFSVLAQFCGDDPDSNAYLLADAVHDTLQEGGINLYLQFFQFLNAIQDAIAALDIDASDLPCDCLEFPCGDADPVNITWTSTGATPDNWESENISSQLDFPLLAGITPSGGSTRSSGEAWTRAGTGNWVATNIIYNLYDDQFDALDIHSVSIRGGGSSGNQKVFIVLVYSETQAKWLHYGTHQMPIGSPSFVTRNFERFIPCVRRVCFIVWSQNSDQRQIVRTAINELL